MPKLKTVMRANAATCLFFGTLLLTMPSAITTALSDRPAPWFVVAAIGAALILNGFHLLIIARNPHPRRSAVIYFSIGDFAWVGLTIALIAGSIWITTPMGIAWALGIAAIVGFFGWRQMATLEESAA